MVASVELYNKVEFLSAQVYVAAETGYFTKVKFYSYLSYFLKWKTIQITLFSNVWNNNFQSTFITTSSLRVKLKISR